MQREVALAISEQMIKGQDQLQDDISHCLFCIYNSQDISQYFKQLLRVQKKLKEWRSHTNPKLLFDLFTENIKEYMKGIKLRIAQDMKKLDIVLKVRILRRHSADDYFLIDNSFSKNYSIHSSYNEFLASSINYLASPQYETVRKNTRYNAWKEVAQNKYKVQTFY
jgi:hypothetical protein